MLDDFFSQCITTHFGKAVNRLQITKVTRNIIILGTIQNCHCYSRARWLYDLFSKKVNVTVLSDNPPAFGVGQHPQYRMSAL